MKILVKIGGAQLASPEARANFCASVAQATRDGHQVIIVHGGGEAVRLQAERLGLETRKVMGLRVTDAQTAEVALGVLGGTVNRTLVADLQAAGVRAAGLTGADGGSFAVRPHRPSGRDLGYVGEVCEIDGHLMTSLLKAGIAPVIASVAPLASGEPGASDHFYNVNADAAAGPLAAALEVDALLFLTDVPAVLGEEGVPLTELNTADAAVLRAQGVLGGGMLPKLDAALSATPDVPLVRIACGRGEDALQVALEAGQGTTLHA